ncbi:MAG: hypothetical protein ABI345_12150 [Jatrophihabitans sp.]
MSTSERIPAHERVRVTHPRTDAARRVPARPAAREIDEQTELGDLYMSSLIRGQRRLALGLCAAVAVLLIGTALAFALAPRLGDLRIFGLALPWVVLGALVYPVMIALGWYAVRSAEHNERTFIDLVRER